MTKHLHLATLHFVNAYRKPAGRSTIGHVAGFWICLVAVMSGLRSCLAVLRSMIVLLALQSLQLQRRHAWHGGVQTAPTAEAEAATEFPDSAALDPVQQ